MYEYFVYLPTTIYIKRTVYNVLFICRCYMIYIQIYIIIALIYIYIYYCFIIKLPTDVLPLII